MNDDIAKLRPDVREKVLQSREAFRIASEIADAIRTALPDIEDLSVAYSKGVVSVSGVSESPEARGEVAGIALQHPLVTGADVYIASAFGNELL
ncbi:hypothetical protein MA04_02135 [Alcanivorax balearicus MACL04]|uniref:Uncharacterized protein n=1 Tax=Alloalcanivorax balearicus MACL04 TaxID=1177182 RepID=A0ABT2QZA0_9GAMM|nr:hypothetical protein [Alloalcanivorax balearicus]MCU5782835.1 hypothetical protein [Alloalcanivorax balearicus MACL04]